MNYKQLDATLSVSEQIAPADVPALAARGFRSIICSRPDGEGWGQPRFAEIEAAATAARLRAAYLPIVPGTMSHDDVRKFGELLDTLPGPILGYCRSGARVAGLWSAAKAAGRGRAAG